ncbi:MAG: type II toxin-antitoxin system HicB family antitoxin [Eubacteriaceae bacterium]|jgi:predicted HicB family RNase H-like nuclease|nr:type II toxin-antitoxin system HicB family antitoxin [Eubacteriaceae bacterium]
MKYGFNVYKTENEDHCFWIAKSEDLKGCVGQGETVDEAIAELKENEEEWLNAANEYGMDIPDVTCKKENEYSGKFVVRVGKTVHEEAVQAAGREGISLNQYVNNAIVAMNAAGSVKQMMHDYYTETVSTMKSMFEYKMNDFGFNGNVFSVDTNIMKSYCIQEQ